MMREKAPRLQHLSRRSLLRGVTALGALAMGASAGGMLALAQSTGSSCASNDKNCFDRQRAKGASDLAREYLNLGDASLAVGDMPNALRFWQTAVDTGKAAGAQAALVAVKRLHMYTSTCTVTPDSIAAISRNYQSLQGDLIHVRVLQRALQALGYYSGPLTGELGPLTRAAIRKFQLAMAFSETDALAPYQIVYLICNAAETANDPQAQSTLGIMYAAGLGVQQNMDFALEWLRQASNRGYADATFNLAILYGTGIILNSFRLCDFPYSPEQADQYLKEACEQKHPIALTLMRLYGPASIHGKKTPKERWMLIEAHQLQQSKADKTGLYSGRLASLTTKCGPDKSIR